MSNVIIRNDGINWIWYYELKLKDDTAFIVNKWRAHKYDERGRHPKSHEITPGRPLLNQHDIKAWMNDGRPGGFDGLRNNYSKPNSVTVNGHTYILIEKST